MSEIDKDFFYFRHFAVNFESVSNRSRKLFLQKPTVTRVWSLLNVCQLSESKRIEKVHKMQKNKNVEIFRTIWSHSEVLLKQNAATFSSKNVMQSSFIRC